MNTRPRRRTSQRNAAFNLFAAEILNACIPRARPAPTTNVWYHLAHTWTGSSKALWLNGAMIGDEATSGIVFDGQDVVIGADMNGDMQDAQFVGVIDDVRIYNRALSAPEILALATL